MSDEKYKIQREDLFFQGKMSMRNLVFEAPVKEFKMSAMSRPNKFAFDGNLKIIESENGKEFDVIISNDSYHWNCQFDSTSFPVLRTRENTLRFAIQIKTPQDIIVFTGQMCDQNSLQILSKTLTSLTQGNWNSKENLLKDNEEKKENKGVKRKLPTIKDSNNSSSNDSFPFKENTPITAAKQPTIKGKVSDQKPLNSLSEKNDTTPPIKTAVGFYGNHTPGLIPKPIPGNSWKIKSLFPKFISKSNLLSGKVSSSNTNNTISVNSVNEGNATTFVVDLERPINDNDANLTSGNKRKSENDIFETTNKKITVTEIGDSEDADLNNTIPKLQQQQTNSSLNFDDNEIEVKDTISDFEETELKKVLELSMQEFEMQQRTELEKYSSTPIVLKNEDCIKE